MRSSQTLPPSRSCLSQTVSYSGNVSLDPIGGLFFSSAVFAAAASALRLPLPSFSRLPLRLRFAPFRLALSSSRLWPTFPALPCPQLPSLPSPARAFPLCSDYPALTSPCPLLRSSGPMLVLACSPLRSSSALRFPRRPNPCSCPLPALSFRHAWSGHR